MTCTCGANDGGDWMSAAAQPCAPSCHRNATLGERYGSADIPEHHSSLGDVIWGDQDMKFDITIGEDRCMSATDISTAAGDALCDICGCLSTPDSDAITRALDALDEIEELHSPQDSCSGDLYCNGCDASWPCATVRLATGLTDAELVERRRSAH